MFNLFKKMPRAEKLQAEYLELLRRLRSLSTSNRAVSEKLYAQAQEVLKEIDRSEKTK